MTAPNNPDNLIRAFLDEGQAELPDRAFDAVRRDIHRTHQRVVIGPWREPDMSTLTRVAIAAAAILAVGFAWYNLSPSSNRIAGVPPAPTPTVAPTPTPEPSLLPITGAVAPGRYRFATVPMSIEVPAGWTSDGGFFLDKNYGPADADAGAAFAPWDVTGTFVDPCTDHRLVEPAPASIDDLANVLAHQPGTTAIPPQDVTIDGYYGKSVEVTVTADISTCDEAPVGFWLWASPGGDRRYVQGNDETNRIYILDVNGKRLTFNARIPARTTAADRAELESIIDSIEINP